MTHAHAKRGPDVIKWFVGFVLAVHVLFGLWAADRAWTQVRRLEMSATPVIAAGSMARVDVVTSGRTPVTVVVTLTQGARTDTIAVQTISGHRDGFWDPRFISRSFVPRVTPTQVAHFLAGRAVLRAEARGRPQWLREPPPVVRELPVTIARS